MTVTMIIIGSIACSLNITEDGVVSTATFRQLKFRTTDGFGAMHIEYSVVGPLTAVWN